MGLRHPKFEISPLAEPDRDRTAPLPEEFAEPAPGTPALVSAKSAGHSIDSGHRATVPTVGPGTVLRQRYVLEREIGVGGMGTVYRALDRNKQELPPPHRYVAIKVLREQFARRPDALQVLSQEAHQAQSLTHPGIVKVFDFDRDGDVHFITMELLEGELLSDLIARLRPGRLPRKDAIDILRRLGAAVSYAHSRGVLHMDLKPGNVMITPPGEVRVLDFGLAYPHRSEPWISEHPTVFLAATPTYASCEQLAGIAPEVRDDVFSFACVAYELLTGEHPFGRRSACEARDQGVRLRRLPMLSRREWRALRQGLAWKRAERPRSLAEMLQQLGFEATSQPARTGPSVERPDGKSRISRWLLAVAGLGILAIALSFAWVRLAPDDVRVRLPGILGADPERPSPRQGQGPATPPEAAAMTLDSLPPVSLVADESLAVPDWAAALARTPAPSPVIALGGPGRLALEAETVTVSESAGAVPLRVVRRDGGAGIVSFGWRVIEDSAAAERDYAALGAVRETFGPGEMRKTIYVPIVADAVPESTELFDVVIEEPTGGATLGAITQVTVIVVDDD